MKLLIVIALISISSLVASAIKLAQPEPTSARGSRCSVSCDCGKAVNETPGGNTNEASKSCYTDAGRLSTCGVWCGQ